MRGVKKAATGRVVKAHNHGLRDTFRVAIIAKVGSRFPRIHAGQPKGCIIVQHSLHWLCRLLAAGIRHHAMQTPIRLPRLAKNAIQRTQGKPVRALKIQHSRGFKIRRNRQSIPVHIDRLVNIRRGPLQARGIHFLSSGIEQRFCLFHADRTPSRHLCHGEIDVQSVLLRIVVHVPHFTDVEVGPRDPQLLRSQYGGGFCECPREIIPIVIERIVGILRGIKPAALSVA